jgi:hypothetical protein
VIWGSGCRSGPDVDNEELAELNSRLRNELLDLDVDDVVQETASGDAPADSKGVALGAIGGQQDRRRKLGRRGRTHCS